ncbi:MAG: hypothetical protein V5A39_00375 [Haloarculaceae archaeon]
MLAGVGLGVLGLGGVVLLRSRPEYTYYTYANDGDIDNRRLRIAWYERYNGRLLETQAGPENVSLDAALDPDSDPDYVTDATLVTDVSGPVIAVGNVLPGDEGGLVVGLETLDSEEFIAEPLDVWLQATITEDAEDGINEPEAVAGDTTADGELDEDVLVEVWRDGSPLGTCNGRKEFDESFESPIVELAPVTRAFSPGTALGSDSGVRVLPSLDPGRSRCIALAWTFPVDATNRSQGDSVGFRLTFAGVPAGTESPFERGGA